MTISEFNPDCMDIEELDTFGRRFATDDYQARAFFEGAPDGYMTAYAHLIMYAILKSRAMELRANGDIQGALWCEGICERIYSALPDFARW